MIELDAVTKLYGDKRVVDAIGFTVPTGAFCALVGPSGSGKSTMLRLINRLIEKSAGTIRVGGEDVETLPVEALRRRIGYAIQSVGLFPHWTVADNIATVPRLLKWPEPRIRDRVRELMALVQLDADALETRYPHQLSGGQQQRVGVARALAADPELLLMDEPFGALDPIARLALRGELGRIHKATGKTILFVTHDIDEGLQLADVMAVLRAGRLVQFGAPVEILTAPADDFVRDFVGGKDLGLKLLALRRVCDHLRPDRGVSGAPIALAAPMSEALSRMVVAQTALLPVNGPDGAIAGSVALADMVA